MQSLSTAKLGLLAQQKRVDTIANNIANINTNGYKASNVHFKDAFYTAMQNPVGGNMNLQQGTGVIISSISRSYAQGTPVDTGEPLDMCITGDGFFSVLNNGQAQYTRDGCFAVASEPDGMYLVTRQGYYVLDDQLQKIKLPDTAGKLSVNESGQLSVGTGVPFARLNIASFANNDGLEATGNNCFVETAVSGRPGKAQDAKVKQGFLESSNVDLALEMSRLIRAQRSYSLASRAVTTADEMQSVANTIRR